MLKRFLLTLLTILAVSQISAAGFPKPKFVATFSKTTVKSGDIIEIIVRFDVAKGFHVYSEKSDCPEDDGPIRASFDFTPNASYQIVGKFYGVGDHMVKETDIWNCSTGEFVGKGEFRQKIKVLGSITGTGIEMIFNGQICNESGCDNIRDQKITTPTLTVSGPTLAADPIATPNTETANPSHVAAQNNDSSQIAVTPNTESNPDQPAYRS